MNNPEKGWYSDPDGKPCERYWDGEDWTNKTRPISGNNQKTNRKKIKRNQIKNTKIFIYLLTAIIFILIPIMFFVGNKVSNSGKEFVDAKYGNALKNTPEVSTSKDSSPNSNKKTEIYFSDENCIDFIWDFQSGIINSLDENDEKIRNCITRVFKIQLEKYGVIRTGVDYFCDEWNLNDQELRDMYRQRVKNASPILALEFEGYCKK